MGTYDPDSWSTLDGDNDNKERGYLNVEFTAMFLGV